MIVLEGVQVTCAGPDPLVAWTPQVKGGWVTPLEAQVLGEPKCKQDQRLSKFSKPETK